MTAAEVLAAAATWREVIAALLLLHAAIVLLLVSVRARDCELSSRVPGHRTPHDPVPLSRLLAEALASAPMSSNSAAALGLTDPECDTPRACLWLAAELRDRTDLGRVPLLLAFLRIGATHPSSLTGLVADPAPEVRQAVMRAAAGAVANGAGSDRDLEATYLILAAGLVDSASRVRAEACRALGSAAAEWALPRLSDRLLDGDDDVRKAAAAALGRLRHADAVLPLATALEDARPELAQVIVRALVRIGGPVPPAILDRARDREIPRRSSALRIIGALGAIDGALEVALALDDPAPRVRREAARVLGEMASSSARALAGSPAVARLAERLRREDDPLVLGSIVAALARTGDASARTPLLAHITRSPVALREQIVEALALLERLIATAP